ncbi:hypothetical protein MUK42_17531 [Musa troglodytarum]|uniref:Complex 1 LYR protein domain-containing protein n=1 Tax=Musa troglodytarum TaxID=320322 RepID=A0A9E7KNQ5_9LILI|nr:hypothetical protein MUK42_17531 [Musa troglodytarum]
MPSIQAALPPELADNVIRVMTLPHFSFARLATFFDSLNFVLLIDFSCIENACGGRNILAIRLPDAFLQQHNTELVVGMVRQQFRKHMHETDPEKIQKLKDDAARGLINHMLYESEKMTGRKFAGFK